MSLWNTLETLQQAHWVELSHTINNESPVWSGIPEGSVDLSRTVFDFGNPLLDCRIQTFKFPGQLGTHIDYPGHFLEGAPHSDAFVEKDLAFPLVVIDVHHKVPETGDYELTIEDILEHEATHGQIPAGSFVALRTDWSKRWPSAQELNNFDDEGGEHAPGWTVETLKFLYEERGIAANGHETIDTDASTAAAREEDLAAERYVLANGHVQVELLDNLDQLPATGAIVFVAAPRIEGATGLPARVWAVFE